eukprot:TRINITY_DN6651_c0_g1_i1.p1 TRINITY_DN6651_c0_g1~~TRINITY_DN6651_c0_g1_i1.p1  ORF type:complete len:669 (-),score=110.19 TRINITY_DN6651_c0_g1_i1:221-2227(-)
MDNTFEFQLEVIRVDKLKSKVKCPLYVTCKLISNNNKNDVEVDDKVITSPKATPQNNQATWGKENLVIKQMSTLSKTSELRLELIEERTKKEPKIIGKVLINLSLYVSQAKRGEGKFDIELPLKNETSIAFRLIINTPRDSSQEGLPMILSPDRKADDIPRVLDKKRSHQELSVRSPLTVSKKSSMIDMSSRLTNTPLMRSTTGDTIVNAPSTPSGLGATSPLAPLSEPLAVSRSKSSGRLIQRCSPLLAKRPGQGESPESTGAVKYPTYNTPSSMKSSHRIRRNMSDSHDLNVTSIRELYDAQRQEADEKFVVDEIISSDSPLELHVTSYIIFKCVQHWDPDMDNQTAFRLLDACDKAMKAKTALVYSWLSTSLSLIAMIEDQLQTMTGLNVNIDFEFEQLSNFRNRTQLFAINAFELALSSIFTKIEPLLKQALIQITASSPGELNEASNLSLVFLKLTEYGMIASTHCLYDHVKKIFFQRIFHYLSGYFLDALVHDGNNYGQGIQIKMVMSKIEDWARSQFGSEIASLAEKGLDPVRQASNVICLLQKEDLVDKSFRETVCPSLRPLYVVHILEGYKPDQFDKTTIPSTVLDNIRSQDETYVPNASTFDPQKPLQLSFEFEFVLPNLENMVIPKTIAERPGLSFLKLAQRSPVFDTKLPPTQESW